MECETEDSLPGRTATFLVGEEVAEYYFKMQGKAAYSLRILYRRNLRNYSFASPHLQLL